MLQGRLGDLRLDSDPGHSNCPQVFITGEESQMLHSTLCVPPFFCLEDGCSPKFSRLPKSEDPLGEWLRISINCCNLHLSWTLSAIFTPHCPPNGRPGQQQARSDGFWDSSLSRTIKQLELNKCSVLQIKTVPSTLSTQGFGRRTSV